MIVATLIGCVGSYLNWGFGLVLGGIVAKKLASLLAEHGQKPDVLLLSRDQSDQFARITGTLLRVYGGRE